ncbi:D-glycero-beta-D-manno-heptose 1-phosphate adenylyltransferase [Leptolyngbya ohadii]|uniref:D-glycero-beta-D-manno-heptose 1-phosphate adenylyltransferase n=1 Tax=Leptolyngbya ohadii TaxID=1962290 RepID=UPI000B599601|nr:D-glycero-beta-D-manno-heptose 1-phosphate adenylyltransferase [Leptolyngbya ohadii]
MNDLSSWIDRWSSLTVLVVGDVMLDAYLSGEANRLCQEAPVPVVAIDQRQDFPGGAANVAANVAALGARPILLSVIGQDAEGDRLVNSLGARSVEADYLIASPDRGTLAKQRVVAQDQLLLRFDQGSTAAISAELETQLIDRLTQVFPQVDAVIISDYGYGILTPKVIETIAELQTQQNRILVVDSKQLANYQRVQPTAVKPNYGETIRLLDLSGQKIDRVSQIMPCGDRLLKLTGAKIVAATLDSEGAILFQVNQPPLHILAQPVPANQTSGAGDTFITTLALSLAAEMPLPIAAQLTHTATQIVTQQPGTSICTANQLRQQSQAEKPIVSNKRILDRSQIDRCLEVHRTAGQRIVFTNGCFDLLHPGHVTYLQQAKALGDVLVVGVNSDESVRQLKGMGRPVNSLDDRLTVLAALESVNYVIPFSELTPHHLIELIRPDIFVKGGDYTRETLPEASLVEQLGGEVYILPFVDDRSTTRIINQIRSVSPIPPSQLYC